MLKYSGLKGLGRRLSGRWPMGRRIWPSTWNGGVDVEGFCWRWVFQVGGIWVHLERRYGLGAF